MAVAAKDMPITREMVHEWLVEYHELSGKKPRVEYFIAGKVNDLGIDDPMVSTQEHENLTDQTSVVEMILDDLSSYGPYNE